MAAAGAAGFGSLFQPGPWYEALQKPPLNPPGWVFGLVWSILYLAIAVSGWLVWRARSGWSAPLSLWAVQLGLNAAWSFLFFGLQRPGIALVEIALLLIVLSFTTVSFLGVRRLAGFLFLPYTMWVGFAVYLNAGIWLLNR